MLIVLWNFALFNGLSAHRNAQRLIHFRTSKTAALLAYLVFHPDHPHSRERLADMLWPDADIELGRASLRTALASLRRQLEPPDVPEGSVLGADRTHIWIEGGAITTDVAQFAAILKASRRATEAADRIRLLTRAVGLYRGELLPGVYEEWTTLPREQFAQDHLTALLELARLLQETGEQEAALRCARGAVATEPVQEEGRFLLIRLLAEAGRRSEALRQYQEWESIARTELGMQPAPELRQFAAVLREGKLLAASKSLNQDSIPQNPRSSLPEKPASMAASKSDDLLVRPELPSPAAQSIGAPGRGPNSDPADLPAIARLPLVLTRFFGREQELKALAGEIVDAVSKGVEQFTPRLWALTGMGGVGKTRLAIETARHVSNAFACNIWFVSLAEISEATRIPQAIEQALGLPGVAGTDPMAGIIVRFNSHVPALLVLDTFEHLHPEGLDPVLHLLARCPNLYCLATSRLPLGIAGARTHMLHAFPFYDGEATPLAMLQCPAVQMFVDRARAARPDFQITPRNAPVIAEICRQLEGVPLALELAAARAGAMTLDEIHEQLAHPLDFLVSQQRGIPTRHQSLRASFAWSYGLLSPEQKRILRCLSVFPGEFTVVDSQSITLVRDIWGTLEALCSRALLTVQEKYTPVRFRMSDVLRRFAFPELRDKGTVTVTEHTLNAVLSPRHPLSPTAQSDASKVFSAGPMQTRY